MIRWVRSLLTPPVFEGDEEKTRTAELLNVILRTIFLGALGYGIFAPIDPQLLVRRITIIVPLLVTSVALWWAMQRGHIRAASWLLIVAVYLAFTAAMGYGAGYNNPAFMGYLVVAVAAGLLLGRRAALIWALISLATSGIILAAANYGLLVAGPTLASSAFWIAQALYLLTVAVLLSLTLGRIEKAFARAQASEAQYRMLFEEAPDGIAIADENNRTMLINPAAIEMLGYTPSEFMGAGPEDIIAPEDIVRQPPLTTDELRRAGTLKRERSLIRKDGSRFSVIISSRHMPDGRFQHIVRDITESKRAESDRLRRLGELEAVNRISGALRAAQTLDEMLPRLLAETLAVVDSSVGAIWLFDVSANELRPVAARGWFAGFDPSAAEVGRAIGSRVLATGEIHLSPDFASDPWALAAARAQIPPGWGGACIPIRTSTETVGVLFVSVQSPRELHQQEIHLLTTLSEMAGSAIHRMSLHALLEQHVQRLTALRTLDMTITNSLDLTVTLNVLLDQVIHQMGVDAAAVLLLNEPAQLLQYAAGRGFRAQGITQTRLRLGEGYAGRAALERRIVSSPNPGSESADIPRKTFLTGEDFKIYYGVPLLAKGSVKGVLELFHRSPLSPDPEWWDFLETLAGQAAVAIDDAELFEQLQRSNAELSVAYEATIEGWSRALELRDQETEGHTERVTGMTLRLARAMGFGEPELVHVHRGALLHDIGKMGIPDSILLKQGELTEQEWAIMRRHPTFAYDMLFPISYLRPALDIPYCHHERWDGSGYPRRLEGQMIPLAARVFAVADVWDALRSDRPYRPAWPVEAVREHLRAQAGRQFDAGIVETFLRLEAEPG